jgi:hypothetical protein
LHRDLITLRRSNPALRRSDRATASASASGKVLTMVRVHGEGTVVAVFNLSGLEVGSPMPEGGPWTEIRRGAASVVEGGDTVRLGPWKFEIFQSTPEHR